MGFIDLVLQGSKLFGENFIFLASNNKMDSSTKDLCLAQFLHKA